MPLFNQEIRSKQSTRTKIGRVVRSEGGYVDVIAVGGNTVLQKVKTGGLSPNVGDYVTVVFHSDGERQAIPISSKEQVASISGTSSSGVSSGGGVFVAGDGLSTTIAGVTNVNVVAGRTQITSNAVDVNTSLLPTPLVGQIGYVAYVSAAGQLSYSSTLSISGVQVILTGTGNRIMGDFSSTPRTNRALFQSTSVNGATNVGAIPNGSGTSSAFTSFGSSDPDNSKGVQISGTSTEAFINSFQTSSGTLSALALLFKINSSEAARFTANKAFLVGKTSQALADSLGNVEINDSLWIGNLLKIAGATSGLATIQAAATVTPTLTLPSTTGTLALASDITSAISGTSGKIPKFTGTNSIGDSSLSVTGASMSALNINAGLSTSRTSSNTLLSLSAIAITSGYTSSLDMQALNSDGGGATMTVYSGTTAGTGYVTLQPALRLSGSTSGATLIKANAVAGSGTLTLPTATGTLALTSDIPTVSGTTGTIAKFTASTTIGNSIITESGAAISVAGAATVTGLLQAGTKIIDITRTVAGGSIGNYTEIGNFSNTYGAHALRITLVASQSGVSIAKEYILVTKNAQTSSWVVVPANKNTGYYGYDFHLIAMQSAAALNLRIVCFRNNNAANIDFNVCIENVGWLTDTWTATSAASSMTVPTAILSSSTDDHAIGSGYMLTRTIPTTVGNYVEICNINGVNGNGMIDLTMGNIDGGFVISKRYLIPMTYNLAGSWCIVNPITSTGPYSGNDCALIASQSSTTLSLRILRISGSTAGTMVVWISNSGDYNHFFDEASGTGSIAVPTIYHPGATLTQTGGGSRVIGGYLSGDMDIMTYATTISLNVALGNLHKTTTVNATGNATINASGVGVAGQHMWVLIVNDATSGKVITFGTNFKPNGTLTGTISKSATVEFVSDGVSWWEVARTLAL